MNVRTTLEPPDPLFAWLSARAASQHVTLKQLLPVDVEQGLNATPTAGPRQRSTAILPRLEAALAMGREQLSNAVLFELLVA